MTQNILSTFLDSEQIEYVVCATTSADKKKYQYNASIFTHAPEIAIIPANITQLIRTVQYAVHHSICIAAYGGGSNTGGAGEHAQAVIDMQKLNTVALPQPLTTTEKRLAPKGATHTVEVEAGVRMGVLEKHLQHHSLCFPIELSSKDRATVGGALSTKAGSPQSYAYSSIDRWVEHIRFIDGTGREVDSSTVDCVTDRCVDAASVDKEYVDTVQTDTKCAAQIRTNTALNDLNYRLPSTQQRATPDALHHAFNSIKQRMVADARVRAVIARLGILKHSSGYNLCAMVRSHSLKHSLNGILCGAMGTLGIITRARLYCTKIAKQKRTISVTFRTLAQFLRQLTPFITLLRGYTSIVAIELLPVTHIHQEATVIIDIIENATASDDTCVPSGTNVHQRQADAVLRALLQKIPHISLCAMLNSATTIKKIWSIRKKVLHQLSVKHYVPLAIVNDITVPITRVRACVLRAFWMFRMANIPLMMYGHIGDGNLHLRPLLRLAPLDTSVTHANNITSDTRYATTPENTSNTTHTDNNILYASLTSNKQILSHRAQVERKIVGVPHTTIVASRTSTRATPPLPIKLIRIATRIYQIVLRYGGVVGGEHGTGMLRAPYMRKQWGGTAYRYMKEINTLFNPHAIFDNSAILCTDLLRTQIRKHHTIFRDS